MFTTFVLSPITKDSLYCNRHIHCNTIFLVYSLYTEGEKEVRKELKTSGIQLYIHRYLLLLELDKQEKGKSAIIIICCFKEIFFLNFEI